MGTDYFPDMTAKRAELMPDRIAFVAHETGRQWTFAEVDDSAARLAAGLLASGLKPGDRLAVLTLNCVEFFLALFACQKAGIVMAPLNWRQPVAELAGVLGTFGPTAIAYDATNREAALELARGAGMKALALGEDAEADADWPALVGYPPVPPRRLAGGETWYLLLTSGTTGLPKAVIQTPRMGWSNAINIGQAIDLTSEDSSVNFLPLFHTGGINLYTLPVFLFGGTSTVLPKFDADAILALLRAGAVTQFFGVPAIYQAFSLNPAVGEVDWPSIRCACGGAPLPEPLIHFFADLGTMICNGMGMTETGPTAFLMDRTAAPRKIGSVGKTQMMTEARLDGVADGAAGEGELMLRGPAITPGYYGNPAATEAAFAPGGWLRTGDVARRDADGYYFIVDRIKDMYISGGENVYPAEVERVLNDHPDILEAAVVGIADERWGEVGAAFLLARPGHDIDLDALNPWCRERLAAYKVPKAFRVVDELPRTPAGKVRKPDLRDMLA